MHHKVNGGDKKPCAGRASNLRRSHGIRPVPARIESNQVTRLCSKHLHLDIVLIFLFVGGKFVLLPNTSKEPHKQHLSSLLCVNKNTEFGVSFHISKSLGYNESSRFKSNG